MNTRLTGEVISAWARRPGSVSPMLFCHTLALMRRRRCVSEMVASNIVSYLPGGSTTITAPLSLVDSHFRCHAVSVNGRSALPTRTSTLRRSRCLPRSSAEGATACKGSALTLAFEPSSTASSSSRSCWT